jgi:hypothetical protein
MTSVRAGTTGTASTHVTAPNTTSLMKMVWRLTKARLLRKYEVKPYNLVDEVFGKDDHLNQRFFTLRSAKSECRYLNMRKFVMFGVGMWEYRIVDRRTGKEVS